MSCAARPVFFYDLRSPWCWLVAERVNSVLGEVPVWQPVRPLEGLVDIDRAAVDRRAREQGLPAVRWPGGWPGDVETATRAAAFAQASARAVAFSLAALRQAFAGGRDLAEEDTVLIAAAACELHPRAVLKGIESRTTVARLDAADADAAARGVRRLPAIALRERVLEGPECAERAAAGRRAVPLARPSAMD
jgi:2-hydroxychromene-2-carboxylate isomerase